MKKTQVSTNVGVLTILGGFLAIYQDVKIMDFLVVFQNLTYGEFISMFLPIFTGGWAILHNEKKK